MVPGNPHMVTAGRRSAPLDVNPGWSDANHNLGRRRAQGQCAYKNQSHQSFKNHTTISSSPYTAIPTAVQNVSARPSRVYGEKGWAEPVNLPLGMWRAILARPKAPCTLERERVHSHGHSHGHGHATGNILRWSLGATAAFVVVELLAGFQAHSLALLSDAGHNFTDALALGLAWAGFYLQSKPADETKTYGYHRASVLAAFINALTLVALSVWILYESALRLRAPEPVNETIMMAVAALGLVLNGSIMLALRAASRNDINIRSAFVHMLGDALGSIAIVLGAVAIRYTGWVRVDPSLSIVIALLIVWT